jgi:DNA polymerase-3 subunit chi
MTRVDFYHNAPHRIEAAARIVQKAYLQGLSMVIFAPDLAEDIDRMLWLLPPVSGFLPHCSYEHQLAEVTPILIARSIPTAEAPHNDALLVNLGDEVPPAFSRFGRVVEVIGRDDAERSAGRIRYRHYRDLGYEISAHDIGGAHA